MEHKKIIRSIGIGALVSAIVINATCNGNKAKDTFYRAVEQERYCDTKEHCEILDKRYNSMTKDEKEYVKETLNNIQDKHLDELEHAMKETHELYKSHSKQSGERTLH